MPPNGAPEKKMHSPNFSATATSGVTLVVMIPAYNEEKTIKKVIESIPRKIHGVEVVIPIVIDDGSNDHTATKAVEAGALVVSNTKNQGLAFSFRHGIETALKLGASIIVNTDADNQYDQSQIPDLIEPILNRRADMVLGSRFKGDIEDMPLSKRIGNRLATLVVNFVSGAGVSDGQTGFRAFTRDAALRLNVLSNFTYTQETILEAMDKGLVIVEIPANFRKREDNNRLFGSILNYASRAGFTLIMGLLKYHPLRWFLAAGFGIMLAGLAVGSRVVVQFLETGAVEPYLPSAVFTVLCVIVGIQVMLMGLLASMIKQNRQIMEMQLLEIRKKQFHVPEYNV